jgi:hypothetical protein
MRRRVGVSETCRGERIERWRQTTLIAVRAQTICSESVDRDEQDVRVMKLIVTKFRTIDAADTRAHCRAREQAGQ